MKNRWSDSESARLVESLAPSCGEGLALRVYTSRLLGADAALVLHGGGNTSVKLPHLDRLGRSCPALYVKCSGHDLATIGVEGFAPLDMVALEALSQLKKMEPEDMAEELSLHRLRSGPGAPSIEALMHAFIPAPFIDHCHADAILALTNRKGYKKAVAQALGEDVIFLPYVKPGFDLARAAAKAYTRQGNAIGMVLEKHGLVTWGETARQSYERTVELVTRAERYLEGEKLRPLTVPDLPSSNRVRGRYEQLAPLFRGALALPSGDEDRPWQRFVLLPLLEKAVREVIDAREGKKIALSPPLTSDHLIRTKALPMWFTLDWDGDERHWRQSLVQALADFEKDYVSYCKRFDLKREERLDPRPRVLLVPGMGAVCAGRTLEEATIVRDITRQTLLVKRMIVERDRYDGLGEADLFGMEYFPLQLDKLRRQKESPGDGRVALVTGSAGAIGSGLCRQLLSAGYLVAATDLPGPPLEALVRELGEVYGERVLAVGMDVTDPEMVAQGFVEVNRAWGGVDLLVINAGLAHVATLEAMVPDDFRRLQRVNVEGTLNLLTRGGRLFREQGTGGDVVLISTKNVFAPGASFGAYSATKAASHQLARIASLEMASMDVRVNMVAPDAVFSDGARKSGLWATVGPDRMRARGLDEAGLESYYRERNLLKSRVTADHVAQAVLFFAQRLTPSTGVTLPVDGGLPDATPR